MGAYIINVPDTVDTIIYVNIGNVYDGKTYIASQRVEDLTPYTEPDMSEAYQRGLSDAWEAARKICTNWVLPDSVLSKIFGMNKTIDDIMKESTASEAIEKIRTYEQAQKEKEEQIQVGDEVENTQTGVRFIVTHMWVNNHGEKGVSGFNCDCSAFSTTIELIRKTGRHFPQIAEVLQKMKKS